MAIKLKKNSGGIPLNKGYNNLALRVSWAETNVDIDIMAMVLTDGKAEEDADFVYYGVPNLQHPSGAIKHSGDSRKGGEETITLILNEIPPIKNEIVLIASIDHAINRGQHFGKVPSAIIELIDLDNGNDVIADYNPAQDLMGEICARLIKVFKVGSTWKIEAVPEGVSGLEQIVTDAGLEVADE